MPYVPPGTKRTKQVKSNFHSKVNVFCTTTLNIEFHGNRHMLTDSLTTLTILQNVPTFQNQLPGWAETEG